MVTKERFAEGMTPQQYLDQMGTNKDTFVKFLGDVKIRPEDKKALESLDKKPDLMDQYLNKGMFRSIPVFAFFDENMNEVARLLERPSKMTEELEAKMLEVRKALRAEKLLPWRQDVVNEIRGLLKA